MLQKNFEKKNGNPSAALTYFKELNRIGKFMTVIRLYNEREIEYKRCTLSQELQAQNEYAFENDEYVKRAITELQN